MAAPEAISKALASSAMRFLPRSTSISWAAHPGKISGALRFREALCIVGQQSMERAMSERREPVTVNFKREQLTNLRQLADQENRTLAQQVRHLVAKGLEAEYETEGE
jgi:hypothetical protein